jgi:hypothetical protein
MSEAKDTMLTAWDIVCALNMAIVCLICYRMVIHILSRSVERSSDLLAGMWAVVATVVVFRKTGVGSLSAGIARVVATCVSFALCLLYLLLFPSTPLGVAVLIGIGTVAVALLGRRNDFAQQASRLSGTVLQDDRGNTRHEPGDK